VYRDNLRHELPSSDVHGLHRVRPHSVAAWETIDMTALKKGFRTRGIDILQLLVDRCTNSV